MLDPVKFLAEEGKEEVMLSQSIEHGVVTRGVEYRPLPARAALRPSPDDAPVTIATFPSSRKRSRTVVISLSFH